MKFKSSYVKYILIGALAVYVFGFSNSGIIKRLQLEDKLNQLTKEFEEIKTENKQLKSQLHRIVNDPSYIEDLARSLGYKKAGEKIYKFVSGATNRTNAVTPVKKGIGFYRYREIIITALVIIVMAAGYLIGKNFKKKRGAVSR